MSLLKNFVKCLELKLNHFQHINMVGDKYEDFEMIVSAQKKEKIKNTHKLGQFTIIVQGDRCNITGCTFVQKGGVLFQKNRLQLMIFHKKTQEFILRDALELMKLIFSTFLTFFPKKSDFEVKVTGIRFVWGFLVNVPTVWIWSSTSLKLSCSRDFQKTWSLTLTEIQILPVLLVNVLMIWIRKS